MIWSHDRALMKETAALRTPFTTEHAAWEWFAIKPGGGLQRRWTFWCLVLDLAWTRRNQSGFCFAFMCLFCLSKMHRMWNLFHIHNLPVLLTGGFQGLLACVHEGCLLWISSLHPKSWLVSTSSFTTSMLAKDKLYFFFREILIGLTRNHLWLIIHCCLHFFI